MSYQKQIDDMIGEHVAIFQAELSLAQKMRTLIKDKPTMPYGYPLGVYRPIHLCKVPQVKAFVAKTGGCLSNGVPRVLRAEWLHGNLIGLYCPKTQS
jgi:hypothetical protein